jgi:hypothetical protein
MDILKILTYATYVTVRLETSFTSAGVALYLTHIIPSHVL